MLAGHRHQEFLRFLRKIEGSVASELDIHVILDNYATHKHPAVRIVPTPFVWTASAQSIISKVNKAKETLATHL